MHGQWIRKMTVEYSVQTDRSWAEAKKNGTDAESTLSEMK